MRVAVGQGGGERRLPDVGAPPDAVLVRVVLLRAPRLYRNERVLVRVIAVLAFVAEGTEHLRKLSLVLLGRCCCDRRLRGRIRKYGRCDRSWQG